MRTSLTVWLSFLPKPVATFTVSKRVRLAELPLQFVGYSRAGTQQTASYVNSVGAYVQSLGFLNFS